MNDHDTSLERQPAIKIGSQSELVFDFVDADGSVLSNLDTADSVKFSMRRSTRSSTEAVSRDTAVSVSNIDVTASEIKITITTAESDALEEGVYVAEFVVVYSGFRMASENIPIVVQKGVVS